MSEGSYGFGYADLSHAIQTNSLAVTRAKGITADNGMPVYVVSLAGQCLCGEGAKAHNALITDTMLVDLVVELIRAARDGGMPSDRIDLLLDRALAHTDNYPADDLTGTLIDRCARCGRPEPECRCDMVGAVST